jgi:DNA primase
MMKFNRETLQRIRDQIDIVELVGSYTRLERRGNRWWGLSPFKPEKTPSFSVKPEDGFYYCFATNQGGDIFRFVGEMEGLSFPESVEYLAERAGVTLGPDTGPSREDQERQALRELYDRVTGSLHYLLTSDSRGRAARGYARERGISEEAEKRFRLGYAPEDGRWLYQFLTRKSYSRSFLDRTGLFTQRGTGYALFRNRLMFPISDERGRVVALGGRALSPDDKAKYINSPETPIYFKKRTLYGLHLGLDEIRRTRRVYLTEGYLDVIAMHQAGLENAVAPLGTAFTEEQGKLVKRWADEVVLVFDADTAGMNATFKAALVAEGAGLGCRAVKLPVGSDPAQLFLEGGAEAVSAVVSDPRPVFEFMVNSLVVEMENDSTGNRDLLLQRVFPYISIINSEVRREGAMEVLGDALGVSSAAIRADFQSWRKGEQPRRFETKPEQQPPTHSIGRDAALMLATAQDGGLFAYLRGRMGPDDLQEQTARSLYLLMEDAYRHEDPLPRGLIDRIRDEHLRNLVLQKLTSGEYEGWTRRDVDRAVALIRVRSLEAQARDVELQLKRLHGSDDRGLKQLLERKMAIDQELGNLKVRADD